MNKLTLFAAVLLLLSACADVPSPRTVAENEQMMREKVPNYATIRSREFDNVLEFGFGNGKKCLATLHYEASDEGGGPDPVVVVSQDGNELATFRGDKALNSIASDSRTSVC